jgi:prefoldin subunit 5
MNLNKMNNNLNKKEQLEKLRLEYSEVIAFISELNKTLKKKVIIPIEDGLAYFSGDIVKTNQCRVYLGDDYFIETTNCRAIKILETRLKRLELLLTQQEGVKVDDSNNTTLLKELDNIKLDEDENTIEIKEDLSENEYLKLTKKEGSKIDTEVSRPELESSLQEKLKLIKQRKEQQMESQKEEKVLMRKIRPHEPSDISAIKPKKKDVVQLDLNTPNTTKNNDEVATKTSKFLQDDDI